MKKNISTSIVAMLICLIAAVAAYGESDPNRIRGFDATQAYVSDDMFSVNVMSGTLSGSIPFGSEYPSGGGLSIGARIFYNSVVWKSNSTYTKYSSDGGGGGIIVVPSASGSVEKCHADELDEKPYHTGLGFDLHMDFIKFSGFDSKAIYISPSGAEHRLHRKTAVPCGEEQSYLETVDTEFRTADGSFIKAVRHPGGDWTVYHAGGRIYFFDHQASAEYRGVTRIENRFGRGINITYDADYSFRLSAIGDGYRTIGFINTGILDGIEVPGGLVSEVRVPKYAGSTDPVPSVYSSYLLDYDWRYLEYGPAGGLVDIDVPVLTGIAIPTGDSVNFDYTPYGEVKSVTNALGGHTEFIYGLYYYNSNTYEGSWADIPSGCMPPGSQTVNMPPSVIKPPIGDPGTTEVIFIKAYKRAVKIKRRLQDDGTYAEWFFERDGECPEGDPCVVKTNPGWAEVTGPEGNRKKYAFRADTEFNGPVQNVLINESYGANTEGDFRYGYHYDDFEYYEYGALDGEPLCGGPGDAVKTLKGNATLSYFAEVGIVPGTGTATAEVRKQMVMSDYDGFGRFRKTVWQDNKENPDIFVTRLETYVNYTPDEENWLLNLYDYKMTGGRITADFLFDSVTGAISKIIRRKGEGGGTADPRPGDVVYDYTYTAEGEIYGMTVSGGDDGSSCTEYYSYQNGVLSGTQKAALSYAGFTAAVDANSGLPVTVADANGVQTYFYYNDPLNRITRVEKPGVLPFDYAYPSLDRSTGTVGDTYSETVIDEYGRIVKVVRNDEEGNPVQRTFRYDGADRRVFVSNWHSPGDTDVPGKSIEYDGRGRTIRTILPTGEESWTYYRVMERNSFRYINGEVSAVYKTEDALGRILSVTNNTGAYESFFFYNEYGNLVKTERKKSDTGAVLTNTYEYDGLSRLRRSLTPERGETLYPAYDAPGNILAVRDGEALNGDYRIDIAYDAAGRPVMTSRFNLYDSSEEILSETFYDEEGHGPSKGRMTSSVSRQPGGLAVKAEYYFDQYGRYEKKADTFTDYSGTLQFTQELTRDAYGRIDTFTYPYRTGETPKVVENNYGNGFLKNIGTPSDPAMYLSDVHYGPCGRVTDSFYGNGTSNHFTFDRSYRLTSALSLGPDSDEIFGTGTITYDESGNISAAGDDLFVYDKASRLIHAEVKGNSVDYTLDAFGNILKRDMTPDGTVVTQAFADNFVNFEHTYENNRVADADYTYNGRGDLETDGNFLYHFDELGRLREVADASNTALTSYFYGAAGLRNIKYDHPREETILSVRSPGGSLLRDYRVYFDEENIAALPERDYIGGPGLSAQDIHCGPAANLEEPVVLYTYELIDGRQVRVPHVHFSIDVDPASVTGYVLHYGTDPSDLDRTKEYARIATHAYGFDFTLDEVNPQNTYYFELETLTECGSLGRTNQVSVWVGGTSYSVPYLALSTGEDGSNVLGWAEPEEETTETMSTGDTISGGCETTSGGTWAYNVYRSECPDCVYVKLNAEPITETGFIDPAGSGAVNRYHYRVTSFTLNPGEESEPSGTVDIPAGQTSGVTERRTVTRWHHGDHLGSVRAVTDESGAKTAGHDYLPYGTELPRLTLNAGYNRIRYAGYERDSETGMDYLMMRYYSNGDARFISPDPLAPHDYTYTAANPVNYTDPWGLIREGDDCTVEGQEWHDAETNIWYKCINGKIVATGGNNWGLGLPDDYIPGELYNDIFAYSMGGYWYPQLVDAGGVGGITPKGGPKPGNSPNGLNWNCAEAILNALRTNSEVSGFVGESLLSTNVGKFKEARAGLELSYSESGGWDLYGVGAGAAFGGNVSITYGHGVDGSIDIGLGLAGFSGTISQADPSSLAVNWGTGLYQRFNVYGIPITAGAGFSVDPIQLFLDPSVIANCL